MAAALYLVPAFARVIQYPDVGNGLPPARTSWTGKYAIDPQVTKRAARIFSFAETDVALLYLQAPQAYLDTVAGQSDAILLGTPGNIDNTLDSAAVNAARTAFESTFIPEGIVNIGDTRRIVIRRIFILLRFSRAMYRRFGKGWKAEAQDSGLTLASTWSEFPTALKNMLSSAVADLGLDPQDLGLTNASTMRQILSAIAESESANPVFYLCKEAAL